MIALKITHNTPNFEHWKATFDRNAELREKSGVRRFAVLRGIEQPDAVTIVLEFDNLDDARSMLVPLQQMWQQATGSLIQDLHWQLCEVVEKVELQVPA